ncbi:UNVERIFIED_CONTAM: Replication protein A DNA-binding subunit A [Sesamum radiatum]|uniref:Replication protein A DNA-binding subunit A n=1 Tax=Sesamum radiatum TaxID=300843 RepID=A0AAW2MFJ4_SESRA
MPPINLTEGAIAMLSSGDAQGTDVKPVLQVADIRLVNTQNQNNNERYRILLSDGVFTQQGMLATQRNDLVRSEKLQKGSIVQLTQFVCNLIQNRMIIIIIDLDVIVEKCDPIGEPKQYPTKTDGNVSSVARPSTPSQPMNQPAASGGNPPSYGASSVMSSAPRPNVGGGGVHVPHLGKIVMQAHILMSLYHQPPPMFANRGPIAKNEAPPRIIPIAALNPYQGRWTIKARVTAKGELRHYNNPRGDGKVFSFDLLDSDGGEIRVTCFNAVADQFYIKLSLPCFEDDKSIPQQQFHFRPISDIEGMEKNSVVDVIGVVSSISPSSSIMRKKWY